MGGNHKKQFLVLRYSNLPIDFLMKPYVVKGKPRSHFVHQISTHFCLQKLQGNALKQRLSSSKCFMIKKNIFSSLHTLSNSNKTMLTTDCIRQSHKTHNTITGYFMVLFKVYLKDFNKKYIGVL